MGWLILKLSAKGGFHGTHGTPSRSATAQRDRKSGVSHCVSTKSVITDFTKPAWISLAWSDQSQVGSGHAGLMDNWVAVLGTEMPCQRELATGLMFLQIS